MKHLCSIWRQGVLLRGSAYACSFARIYLNIALSKTGFVSSFEEVQSFDICLMWQSERFKWTQQGMYEDARPVGSGKEKCTQMSHNDYHIPQFTNFCFINTCDMNGRAPMVCRHAPARPAAINNLLTKWNTRRFGKLKLRHGGCVRKQLFPWFVTSACKSEKLATPDVETVPTSLKNLLSMPYEHGAF